MNKQLKPLSQLSIDDIGKIYDINGGYGFQRKKFYQNNLLEAQLL